MFVQPQHRVAFFSFHSLVPWNSLGERGGYRADSLGSLRSWQTLVPFLPIWSSQSGRSNISFLTFSLLASDSRLSGNSLCSLQTIYTRPTKVSTRSHLAFVTFHSTEARAAWRPLKSWRTW